MSQGWRFTVRGILLLGACLVAIPASAGWPFSFLRSPDCAQPAPDCPEPQPTCSQPAPQPCRCCEKREKREKHVCCFLPPLPPRGEVAFAIPARINRESFRQLEKDEKEEAAEVGDNVESLERDLTKLTLVVEKLAESQKQDSVDLSKLTLVTEQIATTQRKEQEDLTKLNLVLEEMIRRQQAGQ